ncbi:MAG: type II toxin-antitoxin system RelE/ParE family toxin, partial [Gammaproteobacteria bacterium]
MPIIGSGVYEIRVRDSTAADRVIYIAKLETAVFVLHAFKKRPNAPRNRISSSPNNVWMNCFGGGH